MGVSGEDILILVIVHVFVLPNNHDGFVPKCTLSIKLGPHQRLRWVVFV